MAERSTDKSPSSAPAPTFSPDEIVGNFRIRELIAVGGMGELYKAHDMTLRRRVAIKTVRVSEFAAKDPFFRQRFQSEAELLAKLENENVVQVYQFGMAENGQPYIVMPFLEGEDLSHRLQRARRIEKEPLDLAEAVDVILGACRGVHLCHQHGIVHRDLKPNNIFLTKDLHGRRVTKVLDFGIAVVAEDRSQRVTAGGVVIGTPGYMAPEQARAEGTNAKSDQYALGALLYTCLTLRKPYEHLTKGVRDPIERGQIMQAASRKELPIPPLREYARAVPADLERAILRALAPNPADRFASVYDFDSAIKHYAPPETQRKWHDYYFAPPPAPVLQQLSTALVDPHRMLQESGSHPSNNTGARETTEICPPNTAILADAGLPIPIRMPRPQLVEIFPWAAAQDVATDHSIPPLNPEPERAPTGPTVRTSERDTLASEALSQVMSPLSRGRMMLMVAAPASVLLVGGAIAAVLWHRAGRSHLPIQLPAFVEGRSQRESVRPPAAVPAPVPPSIAPTIAVTTSPAADETASAPSAERLPPQPVHRRRRRVAWTKHTFQSASGQTIAKDPHGRFWVMDPNSRRPTVQTDAQGWPFLEE